MNIGFDAKRAYHNHTGLGNYSRTLISGLAQHFRQHQYFTYNPKKSNWFSFPERNIQEINPSGVVEKLFPAAWRAKWMKNHIHSNMDLYHGLSHELPYGLDRQKVKSVVTIHDIIFEQFPEQYAANDILIYRKKFKYACEKAHQVIAISEVTRHDLINYYGIPDNKISVCLQSCDERFYTVASKDLKENVKQRFNLHQPYFLYVGSIIPRKNLLSVCQAMLNVPNSEIQLVVIGKGKKYKEEVKRFIEEHHLQRRIIFLEDRFEASDVYQFLPVIYQMAIGLTYPSIKEGFGIPVLEAMASGTPVITSQETSMAEIGNHASILINPVEVNEITNAMSQLIEDSTLRQELISKGYQTANELNIQQCCTQVMNVYEALMKF